MEMRDTDWRLLTDYLEHRSEDAFAELVRRHLNLVYSAALRQVHSPQLAEDIAQTVFTELARKGKRLPSNSILPAWLYQVTHRKAVDLVRREARRRVRERIACEMNAAYSAPSRWAEIEPLLDEAMCTLVEADRSAILLRYFENKSLCEVGEALGVSDDTAQKRVSRALGRLRAILAQNRVALDASSLAAMVSTYAVQAAPEGVVRNVCASALIATALHTPTSLTAVKTIVAMIPEAITMQKIPTFLFLATLGITIGVGVYQFRSAALLGEQVRLRDEQIVQLSNREQSAVSKIDGLLRQLDTMQASQTELLKLRAEVSALRSATAAAHSMPLMNQTSHSEPNAPLGLEEMEAHHRTLLAEARLKELVEALELSPEQARAMLPVLAQRLDLDAELSEQMLAASPESTALSEVTERMEVMEMEIRSMLTDDQAALYRQFRLDELAVAARAGASGELVQMQDMLRLNSAQQDWIFPVLYEQVLREKAQRDGGAWLLGEEELAAGSLAQALDQSVEQRLAAIGPYLSPDQLQTYRRFLDVRRHGMLMRSQENVR